MIIALAVVLLQAGSMIAVRSQTAEPRQPELAIALSVARTEAVRGTSVAFDILLANNGRLPVEVPDASPANRAFRLRLTGPNGFERIGDTASISIREGEHIETARRPSQTRIDPGGRLRVTGDLISWIGELVPGAYSATAQFLNGNAGILTSRAVNIRISEASVVYSSRPARAPFLAHTPYDTAWLLRSPAGVDLYLLQSSPNAPDLAYSSRRIAGLPEAAQPRPALNHVADQVRRVAWIQKDIFESISVPPGNSLPANLRTELPAANLEIVDFPFIGASGSLFAILSSRETNDAFMMELRADGKPAFTRLDSPEPMRTPRSVLWGRDDALALAWTGRDGTSVFAAGIPLVRGGWEMEPARILSGSDPVADITLAQRPHASDEGWDRIALVLSRSAAGRQFQRRRIEISARRIEKEERFTADPATTATLLECALAGDLTPRYLFAGTDGNVRFVSADFSRSVPLMTASGGPVRAADSPTILIASELSARRGVYIRYIEDGKRFAYLKVE